MEPHISRAESKEEIFIPAGTTQQITNTGEKDLVFYAICTPAFEYAAYETLE